MKAFIAILAFVMSFAASADCGVFLKTEGPSGPILKEETVAKIVSRKLENKGYVLTSEEQASYVLDVFYIGVIAERGPTTVGTNVRLIEKSSGKIIAENENEILFGMLWKNSAQAASSTLKKNIRRMLKKVGACEV